MLVTIKENGETTKVTIKTGRSYADEGRLIEVNQEDIKVYKWQQEVTMRSNEFTLLTPYNHVIIVQRLSNFRHGYDAKYYSDYNFKQCAEWLVNDKALFSINNVLIELNEKIDVEYIYISVSNYALVLLNKKKLLFREHVYIQNEQVTDVK